MNKMGVVLGSCWRLAHRFVELDPDTKEFKYVPHTDTYFPLFQPIAPLARRALLYFDKLEYPVNNLMPQAEILHAEFLEKRGVLHRTQITVPDDGSVAARLFKMIVNAGGIGVGGSGVPELIAHAHVEIFKLLERQEPGCWSFATIGTGLDVPSDLLVSQRGINVELYDCLPVPTDDVPYEDIMEFKSAHFDQLGQLRERMSEFYVSLTNAHDKTWTRTREIARLEDALVAVRRLLTEDRISFIPVSLSIDLSLGNLIDLAKNALAVSASEPGSIPLLALSAASAIKIGPKAIQSPIERSGPFGYVYAAGQESIVDPADIGPPPSP